jgi:transcriptional regulator with XRE-family HTH domain
MDPVAQRIKELIDHTGLTNKDFAESVSTNAAIISHILSGRNNPSLKLVQQITNVYTNVNLDYLLNGNGSLLLTEPKTSKINQVSPLDPAIRTVQTPQGAPLPSKVNKDEASGTNTESQNARVNRKPELTNVYSNVNLSEPSKNEKIERVIIFYSDKSMEEYRP